MRRIFAILLVCLFVFLVVMLIVEPVRAAVTSFAVKVAGPYAVGSVGSIVTGVISSVGLSGFAAITMVLGVVGGVLIHFFWVKADWKLRRWGSQRISRDLGTTTVSTLPSTPVGATVRPSTQAVAPAQTVVEELEKKEAEPAEAQVG